MDTTNYLLAYNVRTKQKGRPILNAVLTMTKKGAVMAQGVDEDGTKLTTLISKDKANKAVADGVAAWAPVIN